MPLFPIIIGMFKNEGIDEIYQKQTKAIQDKYGMVPKRSKDRCMVFISDETTVKKIFFNHIDYPKHLLDHFLRLAMVKFSGINIVSFSGKMWRLQRRLMNPVFRREFGTYIFLLTITKLIENTDKIVERRFLSTTKCINQHLIYWVRVYSI